MCYHVFLIPIDGRNLLSSEQFESSIKLDTPVFAISVILVFVSSGLMGFFPEAGAQHSLSAMNFILRHAGWLYLIAGILPLVFCGWLAFGRYGDIKFGAADEKPEYSTLSWVGLMFTGSMGASLIAWGFAEPIFYLQTPPFGIEPYTPEAFEWAHVYPIFHWGIAPWAIYCLPAIPVAYMLYVRKVPSLKISDSCEAAMPHKKNRLAWILLDVFVVIGIVGGVATSIGFGVPLVSSLLSELFNIEDNILLQLVVIALWTAIFGTSSYLGLKRGIKVLSDFNVWLFFILMAIVLLAGPTLYLLNITVNTVGLWLNNFIRMSFWTDPIQQGGFPEAWTIFYWAWWIAYAPMMGLFFARISRGRTIKQVVLGVIGFGCLGTFLFLSLAGGYVLYLEGAELLDASGILHNQGMSKLVSAVIAQLPFPAIVLAITTIASLIFYATTFDSAAFVLASICTLGLKGDQEPKKENRLIWALALGFVAVGLALAGGFETVKSMSVISSLPVIPILVMMCVTLVFWLRSDFPKLSEKKPVTLH